LFNLEFDFFFFENSLEDYNEWLNLTVNHLGVIGFHCKYQGAVGSHCKHQETVVFHRKYQMDGQISPQNIEGR